MKIEIIGAENYQQVNGIKKLAKKWNCKSSNTCLCPQQPFVHVHNFNLEDYNPRVHGKLNVFPQRGRIYKVLEITYDDEKDIIFIHIKRAGRRKKTW